MVALHHVTLHDALHGAFLGERGKLTLVSGHTEQKAEHAAVAGVGRAVDKLRLEGKDVGVGRKVHAVLGVKKPGMAMEKLRLVLRKGALVYCQSIAEGFVDVLL